MAYEFHYTPTGTGVISGKEVLEQTEDAINDLGNTAISGVQEALDKAEQALTNSENAVDDAQTALNTANNAEGVAIQAQNDVSNLSGTVTNLGNRVTTAEGNIDNLQGRMTTAEGNITNLQGRMTTAEGNIGNLQTAVSTAQATANSAQQTATTARQQSYVFRYSSTALTASSTNSNTLLDNTDNLKVGDKVIDSNGVLFSITAIDTANSTFTIGTALIDLANDADVVHKTGNETIGGNKTFTDELTASRNTTNGAILLQNASYDPKTNGQSGVSTKSFSINFATSLLDTFGAVACYGLSDKTMIRFTSRYFVDSQTVTEDSVEYNLYGDGTKSFRPRNNNNCSLGESLRKWKGVYATNYYYGTDNVEFSNKFVTTDTNQTISGNKTFSNNVNVYNSDSSTDTANIILKNSKAERGSTTNIGEQNIFFLDKDNAQIGNIKCEVDSTGTSTLTLQCTNSSNSSSGIRLKRTSGGTFLQPVYNNGCNLGTSGYRWYDVQTKGVNGLEPSSLSLPSGNANDAIDISSYLTYLDGTDNTYVAPANGWITINMNNCSGIHAIITGFWGDSRVRASAGALKFLMPVLKNQTVTLTIHGGTIDNARFIPCQGNV